MAASQQDIEVTQTLINRVLCGGAISPKLRFSLTEHAALDRLNDPRHTPLISLNELASAILLTVQNHHQTIISLSNNEQFTIEVLSSNLYIPCAKEVFDPPRSYSTGGSAMQSFQLKHQVAVKTMMRKVGFKSKDALILTIP